MVEHAGIFLEMVSSTSKTGQVLLQTSKMMLTTKNIFILLATHSLVSGFSPVDPTRCRLPRSSRRLLELFALTPVGPFCPFRSKQVEKLDVSVEQLTLEGPEFATAFARINLDLQMGNNPDKDQVLDVATKLKKTVSRWEETTNIMRNSCDFQTREYAFLGEAQVEKHGESMTNIIAGLKWQADCLSAMANEQAPPPPPPELDLEQMMAAAQGGNSGPASTAAILAAEQFTAKPFTGEESAFQSPTVKEEFDMLYNDHDNLIQLGAQYGNFDPVGKLYYLDEVEKIEERWDIFFTRFSLMKAINPKYIEQCNEFLASMKMNEEEYRTLLKQTHDNMRKEAESERNLMEAS